MKKTNLSKLRGALFGALLGATGFTLGIVIYGFLIFLLAHLLVLLGLGFIIDAAPLVIGLILLLFGLPISIGATTGALLGVALKGRWKALILAGAIGGVLVGFVLLLSPFFWSIGSLEVPIGVYIIQPAVIGAIEGASFGIALWDWRRAVMSPAAGAVGSIIGFSVGMAIHDRYYPSGTPHHLQVLAVIVPWSTIMGAFIGFALGYLEGRKERQPEA
jgi:hypothetical protein